jgi:FkbM family methyltransferase
MLLAQVEFGASGSLECRPFRVPSLPHPVWLRGTRSDRAVFWQCLTTDQYSLASFAQTKQLIEKYQRVAAAGGSTVIIDGGGNIGLAAVGFAASFPEATIYSVEPDSRNFEVLKRNTAPYRNVVPIQAALWTHSTDVVIENPDSGASSFRVRSANAGEAGSIPAVSVDSILERSPGAGLVIVKLDIEGAQQWLFQSETDWVGRADLIILELDDWQYPWRGTSRSFFQCLSRYEYDYLMRGELIFCFHQSRLIGEPERGRTASGD